MAHSLLLGDCSMAHLTRLTFPLHSCCPRVGFSAHGAHERIAQGAADVGIEAVDDLVLLRNVLGAGERSIAWPKCLEDIMIQWDFRVIQWDFRVIQWDFIMVEWDMNRMSVTQNSRCNPQVITGIGRFPKS